MTKQEYQEKLQQIGTCEDDAQRRTLIAELSEDGSAIYDDHATASAALAQAQQDNEALRAANMKLFQRIGDHTPKPIVPEKKEKEPRKFEDLFNDKGGIK